MLELLPHRRETLIIFVIEKESQVPEFIKRLLENVKAVDECEPDPLVIFEPFFGLSEDFLVIQKEKPVVA